MLSSRFNDIFTFLFAQTRYHINDIIFRDCNDLGKSKQTALLLSIYQIEIRRYIGFGFIMSYIPGTNAYLSRVHLAGRLVSEYEKKVFGTEYKNIFNVLLTLLSYPIKKLQYFLAHPFDSSRSPTIWNIFIYPILGIIKIMDKLSWPTNALAMCFLIVLTLLLSIAYYPLEVAFMVTNFFVVDPILFAIEAIVQAILGTDYACLPESVYRKLPSFKLLEAYGSADFNDQRAVIFVAHETERKRVSSAANRIACSSFFKHTRKIEESVGKEIPLKEWETYYQWFERFYLFTCICLREGLPKEMVYEVLKQTTEYFHMNAVFTQFYPQ